jgi:hypothetical protein
LEKVNAEPGLIGSSAAAKYDVTRALTNDAPAEPLQLPIAA